MNPLKEKPVTQAKDISSEVVTRKERYHFVNKINWRARTRNTADEKIRLENAIRSYPTKNGAPDSAYNGRVTLTA